MYPTLARTYLTVIRARGALLLHRTLQLSLRFRAQPSTPWHSQPHAQDTALLAQYWQLVDEVEQHLANLNPALLKASLHPDQHPSTIGLKVCLIATLTAAVELHHLAPSTHVESRQSCLNAVLKLVGIVKTCTMKDHELLDPILGVSRLIFPGIPPPDGSDVTVTGVLDDRSTGDVRGERAGAGRARVNELGNCACGPRCMCPCACEVVTILG